MEIEGDGKPILQSWKDKDDHLVDKTLIHDTYLMAWFLYNIV